MTKFQVLLAVAGLTSHAAAFVPAPATWSRPSAVAAASPSSADRHSKKNRASLAMKKEPAAAARGGKAGGKGAADEASDPRRQALDGVLHQIERCYGRGSILKMGDTTSMDVETSSTGALIVAVEYDGYIPQSEV